MRKLIFIITILLCSSCGYYKHYSIAKSQTSEKTVNYNKFRISIDEVYNFTTHLLQPGDNSYIEYEKDKATIRFSISANILTRKHLYRNNLEVGAIIKDTTVNSFKIEFADSYNYRDFWINIELDNNTLDCIGTVYYYNKPQSRFQGSIKFETHN